MGSLLHPAGTLRATPNSSQRSLSWVGQGPNSTEPFPQGALAPQVPFLRRMELCGPQRAK